MGSYFEIKNLHLQENTEDIFRYIVTFHNQSCQTYHDTVVSKILYIIILVYSFFLVINIIYNYFISFYCSFVIWEGLYLETRLLRTVNVLPPDQLMSCSLYRHKLVLCQVYSKKYFRQFLSGFSFEKLSTWIWCLSKSLYYLPITCM